MKHPHIREAGAAYCLFTTKDPQEWKVQLERLGEVCAAAWQIDLPQEDRAWAEARRKEFAPWADERPAPPWPMLLAAVRRAYITYREVVTPERTEGIDEVTADSEARLVRTYLWHTLSSHDVAQTHGPEALRAFQRGWHLGRRKKVRSVRRDIPPIMMPPYLWSGHQADPPFPGPSAERERVLHAACRQKEDPEKSAAARLALRELYLSAWREDLPEEDRIWAQAYRDACMDWIDSQRQDAVAKAAYDAYLQSSDGILENEPAPPAGQRTAYDWEPWRFVAIRIEDAADDESEIVTAEAAAREYREARWQEVPPWDSDPTKEHWLAAVRAAKKTSAALANHVPSSW